VDIAELIDSSHAVVKDIGMFIIKYSKSYSRNNYYVSSNYQVHQNIYSSMNIYFDELYNKYQEEKSKNKKMNFIPIVFKGFDSYHLRFYLFPFIIKDSAGNIEYEKFILFERYDKRGQIKWELADFYGTHETNEIIITKSDSKFDSKFNIFNDIMITRLKQFLSGEVLNTFRVPFYYPDKETDFVNGTGLKKIQMRGTFLSVEEESAPLSHINNYTETNEKNEEYERETNFETTPLLVKKVL
jgi:hypothetical protein